MERDSAVNNPAPAIQLTDSGSFLQIAADHNESSSNSLDSSSESNKLPTVLPVVGQITSKIIPYQGNSIILPEDVGLIDEEEPGILARQYTFTLNE